MSKRTTEVEWEVPLVDFYVMSTNAGPIPCRQADGLEVSIINCRDDEARQVVALMLYSSEGKRGLLMPLSPETVEHISAALATCIIPPSKENLQ